MPINGLTLFENAEYANLLRSKVTIKPDREMASLVINMYAYRNFRAAAEALFSAPGFVRVAVFAPADVEFPAFFVRAIKTWVELVGGEFMFIDGDPRSFAKLEQENGFACYHLGGRGRDSSDSHRLHVSAPNVPYPEVVKVRVDGEPRPLESRLLPDESCVAALVRLAPRIVNPKFAILDVDRTEEAIVFRVGPQTFTVAPPPPAKSAPQAPKDALSGYFDTMPFLARRALSVELKKALGKTEVSVTTATACKVVMSKSKNQIMGSVGSAGGLSREAFMEFARNYDKLTDLFSKDKERDVRILKSVMG